MRAGKKYIILTTKLPIEKQLWLMFPLYFLFSFTC